MRTRLAVVLPLLLFVAACGDDDNHPARTPTNTPVRTPTGTPPTATPTTAFTNTAVVTATAPPSATPSSVPTNTSVPTVTATAEPTATATIDVALCADGAAAALRACVVDLNEAQRDCYLTGGRACADDASSVLSTLEALRVSLLAACADDAAVRAAGFGAAFTRDSLYGRMSASCQSEAGALASRSFGGPHGAALAEADAAGRQCLTSAHQGASATVAFQLSLYDDCITDQRDGAGCDAEVVSADADADTAQLGLAVGTACADLPALISLDPPTFAARAAAQARCLTAIGHGDTDPLSLDCGPREGLIDTPRGEYVQVVLDSDTYGTRCGDGSPFAFWIRLAPEGAPVDRVVVGMQGGGVCIFGSDCATRPATLFEALSDQPETGGPLSNDPEVSPFADWTKVYLPYCNQDVFIGGGTTSNFEEITVHRFGGVNVRAAMRYVRDVIWRDLDATTEAGYRPDFVRMLFGGFSAGGFGTIYNYHWVLDDLQWAHTAAYPDAGLALDNGEALGVAALGVLLISDAPPLGWGARNLLPSYCTTTDCGVGPVILEKMAPRLLSVPEQQILVLSNQVDLTQVSTTFFSSTPLWINTLRDSYCATRELPGVQYFLPAISENVHVISPREELYTDYPVDGVIMRDWMESVFTAPTSITDQVEEGTLVDDYEGVEPFDCL